MDSIVSSIVLLLLTYTLIHMICMHARTKKRNYNYPPGPSLLTLVGNLSEIVQRPQQSLAKLAMIHGPIMQLKLGQLTTIVISSADIAKEILQTHDLLFSNRRIPQAVIVQNHDLYSMAFLPVSPLWRDLRKICNNQLFSSKTLDASQETRHKKLQELLSDVHRSSLKGEAVDIGSATFRTTINVLSNAIFSLDFVNSAGEAEEYRGIVENLGIVIATPNLVDFFPVLKTVDPQGIRKRSTTYVPKLFNIFDYLINKRLELRGGENFVTNNDMFDSFLNISQESGQKMDKEMFKHLLLDLFVAGTDTTSYAIKLAMTELIHNPDKMSKAKIELAETIGIGNPMMESDITRLPYLQAIVKETLRLHPSAPLLLPRKAKIEMEINGYIVPQGAQVLINAWATGRDPSMWENPNLFSPERFLGSKIDVKGRHFHLIPFGGGRRICPGLPLAMRMLHLILGSFINIFDWELENTVQLADLNREVALRLIPIKINK
ncbi:hypothetical protein RJT34_29314 [Clitoria ternatea]|uniref:Cytochrome P450 n=1 Tax=Clitoria ternatea TaxID=43366 RepID=A0AAN9ID29_CLITE